MQTPFRLVASVPSRNCLSFVWGGCKPVAPWQRPQEWTCSLSGSPEGSVLLAAVIGSRMATGTS